MKKWNGLKNGTPAINSVLLNLLKRKPLWPTTGLVHNCTSSKEVVDNNTSYLISHLTRNERRVSLWHEIKLDYGQIFDLRNHQLLSMCSRYLPAFNSDAAGFFHQLQAILNLELSPDGAFHGMNIMVSLESFGSSHSFAVMSYKLYLWSCSFSSGSARCKANNNVLYAQILLYYLALFRTTRAHTHFIIILMQITNVCCNLGRHIYRCTIERYDFRFRRECRRIR